MDELERLISRVHTCKRVLREHHSSKEEGWGWGMVGSESVLWRCQLLAAGHMPLGQPEVCLHVMEPFLWKVMKAVTEEKRLGFFFFFGGGWENEKQGVECWLTVTTTIWEAPAAPFWDLPERLMCCRQQLGKLRAKVNFYCTRTEAPPTPCRSGHHPGAHGLLSSCPSARSLAPPPAGSTFLGPVRSTVF